MAAVAWQFCPAIEGTGTTGSGLVFAQSAPPGQAPRALPACYAARIVTMTGEHIGELKKWATEIVKSGSSGDQVGWKHAAELISKHFSVKPHEVAILGFTPDERFLRFLTPDGLRPVGRIPLSSTTSLAVRTARDCRAEIINHFSVVPHASVFEGVPVNDSQRTEAIQKIMSSPVVVDKKVVGVAQVSRKGSSAAEAGPDFTPVQLRDLKAIAEILAPCIVLSSTPALPV